jgi:hypothetical protein
MGQKTCKLKIQLYSFEIQALRSFHFLSLKFTWRKEAVKKRLKNLDPKL